MPFTLKVRRQPMLDGTLIEPQPGDLCFKAYYKMLQTWKKERRWTTAHNLYRDMVVIARIQDSHITDHSERLLDEVTAVELAWQVFFALYVMPYEREQREKNGDIE